MSVTIIPGPPISGPHGMSKEAAEQALLRNDEFPKGADYSITAHEGKWVAAISTPDNRKFAEFPPSSGDGDASPSGPPADSGDDDDDGDGDSADGGAPDLDAPPKHKDKGGDKGDKGGLHALEAKIDLLLSALGIDPSGGDPSGGDPMGGDPAGAGPPPPPGAAGPSPDVTVHERAMKPGETPPGGTPLGAPAFSSVQVDPNHPWAHTVGKVAAFNVREPIGNEDINRVHGELQNLAKSGGFKIARFTPFHDQDGARYVEAVVQTPTPQK